jgi:hypothetical protein
MIVSVTRVDLRDEFIMADEAFALSPISARATQPREEDYDAISEAFMETSRGRWFLGEYAKRNRNADTRMVLDAVARIETSLAAQKQPAPEQESGLAEALIAIRSAVDEARAAASAALDSLALEEALAPIRKGSRIIKEIAWRWREIGADGRICDLIDSQVSAIEAGCGQIASRDPLTALSAAFDLLGGRIRELDDSDAAPRQGAEEAVMSPPSPAPSDEMPAAAEEAAEAATAMDDTEVAVRAEAMHAEAVAATTETADAAAEAADITAEPPDMTAEAAEMAEAADGMAETLEMSAEAVDATAEITDMTAEAADVPAEIADAHDDAVLEMVALEMAAPDPSDTDDASDAGTDEIHVAESLPAEPETIAQVPEPEQTASPAITPTMQPSVQTSIQTSNQTSLGSSLIANGIVRRPPASASDPLAPIRRMSQAEKIALFS